MFLKLKRPSIRTHWHTATPIKPPDTFRSNANNALWQQLHTHGPAACIDLTSLLQVMCTLSNGSQTLGSITW
jgi:hypothetical protein